MKIKIMGNRSYNSRPDLDMDKYAKYSVSW